MIGLKTNDMNSFPGANDRRHHNRQTVFPDKSMASGRIVFSLSGVTLRIRHSRLLADTHWTVRTGENWAVIGPNGAGKTTLMRAVTGHVPTVAGKLSRPLPIAAPGAIGYMSFDLEQRFIDRERVRDEARFFSGKNDDRLLAGDIVFQTQPGLHRNRWKINDHLAALDLESLLSHDLRHLSTGELRRVFIGRALQKSKGLLVLDEPFEGLDARHFRIVADTLDKLMKLGVQLILVTHLIEDLPRQINRILTVKNGRVYSQGSRAKILTSQTFRNLYASVPRQPSAAPISSASHQTTETIIDIQNATIRHGSFTVFKEFSWQVNRGENWALSGPNGSGKTTLLRLITGDHLQAYANEIYLFGRRRGTGESIWEIKKRFGVVSAELQRDYRKPIPARNVVRSGFFDSIGLYRRCNTSQLAIAETWIERLNVATLMHRRYDQLSSGERKMVLITRAMVKSPAVLILDEPCQGLDPSNRRRVLSLVDNIGQTTGTQIVFVTHRPDEVPACTTHWIKMPEPV